MLTFYEIFRLITWPFMPALLRSNRRILKKFVTTKNAANFKLLDVGGRKSPYTIGLEAEVTVIDLPKQNEIQKRLNLGLTSETIDIIHKKRSNIVSIILGDFLVNDFPTAFFDGVVSVEVLEHIEQDDLFLKQIYRILQPGGWVYLTTPNGDYIKNEPPNFNPDHKRHYTKDQLTFLMSSNFDEAKIWYGVKPGKYHYWGSKSFSLKHPVLTAKSMICNLISNQESRSLSPDSKKAVHLFALARKS